MTATDNLNRERYAFYWHNGGHGVGHTARNGALGQALLFPQSAVLGITGAHEGFELLPPGMDFVKVPSYTSRENEGGVKRLPILAISEAQLYQMRAHLLETVLADFRPHVLFTDLYPLGKNNELVAGLARMPETILVFGIRGILDETVFAPGTGFFDQMTIDVVGQRFSAIAVYTDPQIFKLEDHYRLPLAWQQKLMYTGYVARRPNVSRKEEARRCLGLDPGARIIVGSFGAGTGKEDMWQAIIAHLLEIRSAFDSCFLAAGVNLEKESYDRIAARVAADQGIVWTRTLRDLPMWMLASDLFIGTGGYNQSAEVLASRVNAFVIASEKYDLEEEVATERMAALKLVRKGRRDELTRPEVRSWLLQGLQEQYPDISAPPILTDGATKNALLARSLWGNG